MSNSDAAWLAQMRKNAISDTSIDEAEQWVSAYCMSPQMEQTLLMALSHFSTLTLTQRAAVGEG